MPIQDLMVDVETTGTNPDRNAVIQLSAWKFDLETGAIDMKPFNQCMHMPNWRTWDEETKAWWLRQPSATFMSIVERMRDPGVVMKEWKEWVGDFQAYRFWAKPTTFDFMFVQSYMKDFDIEDRFDFRRATDMNSFLRGLYYPKPIKEIYINHAGAVHDALFDTLNQIELLFAHVHPKPEATNDSVAG